MLDEAGLADWRATEIARKNIIYLKNEEVDNGIPVGYGFH
jgi:hypothetical protein